MKKQLKTALVIGFGLLVAAAFIAIIGAPNPSVGTRQTSGENAEKENNPDETGWWSQNNSNRGSWW